MRISELLQTQSPSKKRLSDGSVPEVFIIESLTLADENKERREGAVLASILRMCEKKPLYYYIRTRAELVHIAEEFEASGYRYLHISCHGSDDSLETTLDSVSYKDFAQIFKERLDKKRLFVSACSSGNELFAELVAAKSPEILSVAAPADDITFDIAVALWSAFYVKVFDINPKSMNSYRLAEVLRQLSMLFGARIHWSRRSQKSAALNHEIIDKGPE